VSDAFKPLLAKLADGATLSEEDADAFFSACLRGEPTPAQVAAALTAMRLRGETVGEITASARAMRRAAVTLEHPFEVIDTCGTGGDGLHTYNISTAAAFVAAGGGLKVAKHGNRALSSRSGSSDVLAALGVKLDAGPEPNESAGNRRHLLPVRPGPSRGHAPRDPDPRGTRLPHGVQPAGPAVEPGRRQASGARGLRSTSARTARAGARGAGRDRAWTVHGQGMDELTTTGETMVTEWRDGAVRHFTVTPEAVGLPRAACRT
jgi:anthranilate phosphoribosyltransferase